MRRKVEKQPEYKTVDEVFSCDCGTHDHSLTATIMDDRMAILEMHDETMLNIPWYWRLGRALKIFWDAFWKKEHTIEIVLNRHEHKQFKAFFGTLLDERCYRCDPQYLVRGNYFKHNHENKDA